MNFTAVLLMFSLPVPVIVLTEKVDLLKKAGAVAVCYTLGFVLSFIPFGYDKALVQTVSSAAVAVSIPLILFCFNLKSLKKLTRKTLLGFLLMMLSVVLVSSVASFIANFKGMHNSSSFAGMTIGLYIGGTPNLFAVGTALLNDINLINIANISDVLLGGVLFFCIITFLKNIYCNRKSDIPCVNDVANTEYDFSVIKRSDIPRLVLVILLGILCFCLGVVIELLVNSNLNGSLYIIVCVSVLGIAFSFIRPVRETKGTYQFGQYLVLVFTVGLGMSLDFTTLKTSILPIFLFFSCIQISSLILHFILCKIFRIDGEIALITCVAGIYGPPFIVPVANACKDKSLIVPGILCGTLGLAVGNIMGIGFGSLLKVFGL